MTSSPSTWRAESAVETAALPFGHALPPPLPTSAVDRLTSQLCVLGLADCFYPQPLHALASVSGTFQRWTAQQPSLRHRRDTRRWQGERNALVRTTAVMDAARASLSAEQAQRLDAQLLRAWDSFSRGQAADRPRGPLPLPLPLARALAGRVTDALHRGRAELSPTAGLRDPSATHASSAPTT